MLPRRTLSGLIEGLKVAFRKCYVFRLFCVFFLELALLGLVQQSREGPAVELNVEDFVVSHDEDFYAFDDESVLEGLV